MKATGIVRRVDDLGRVVIPKELRKQLRIAEGTPLEIFITEGGQGIVFQKYNTTESLEDQLNGLDETIMDMRDYNEYETSVLNDMTSHIRAIQKLVKEGKKDETV